jgi:hypothetical protein
MPTHGPLRVFDTQYQSTYDWPHYTIGHEEFETIAVVTPGCEEANEVYDAKALAHLFAAAPLLAEALTDAPDPRDFHVPEIEQIDHVKFFAHYFDWLKTRDDALAKARAGDTR